MRTALVFAPLALAACATTAAAPPSSGVATARLGQSVRVGPLRVTPLALLEDSRCPENARCVWAGQVRIRARIATRDGAGERELTLGKPVAAGSGMLVIEDVSPRRRTGATIPRSAYRFSLRYTGNIMPR